MEDNYLVNHLIKWVDTQDEVKERKTKWILEGDLSLKGFETKKEALEVAEEYTDDENVYLYKVGETYDVNYTTKISTRRKK
jgi:hypothetical protein